MDILDALFMMNLPEGSFALRIVTGHPLGCMAVCYFFLMNMIGIVLMGLDKRKAKRRAWRIPEKILFLVSILGGSAGTWAGMYLFRHKTKHWYFVVGMPLIFAAHGAGLLWLWMHFSPM